MHVKETGEGMTNPRGAVTLEDGPLTARALMSGLKEGPVVNTVAKHSAAQAIETSGDPRAVELERSSVTHTH